MRRWPVTVFVLLLMVSLVLVGALGREVKSDLEVLSTAENDNMSWLLAQLEVELLKLEVAVQNATDGTDASLTTVRNRFDIFYSRAATLAESSRLAFLLEDPAVQIAMMAVTNFLGGAIPVIDGPDDQMRAALPSLSEQISSLRPEARELALAAIQRYAGRDATRRAELAKTLTRLASLLFSLFLLLVVAFGFLVSLFRQGQRLARQSQAASNRFEAAITSSLDAVLVVDRLGRIIEYNGAAEEVFGYTKDEAIGADMAKLIVPEHLRAAHQAGMNRFLETGENKVIEAGRIRLEGLRRSGEVFPVELTISLAKTAGEQVFVSFLRDITEELQTEEDLRAARDQARESDQAKSDLLTVMSHEMRTPLNGILGSIELIDRDNLTEQQRRHIRSISVSGNLLLSHVNDVLDFSRLGSGAGLRDRSQFDLEQVVREVADSLSANANARDNGVEVSFLSGPFTNVTGYKTALQQCLYNLIGNAIEFTRDGTISVEVEALGRDDLVEIRVADTGVGIAPEYLDTIFEEFVTIDTGFARETSGTGLGLAITKRLVQAMGGDISADSIPGEGSLFTILLPLPASTPGELQVEKHVTTQVPAFPSGLTALVVDDNEINRLILRDMLQELGFAVEEAESGKEAVSIVHNQAFDIVLLDISMPGIDGIETLNLIRALPVAWRDVPAIAVTAHAGAKDHAVILSADFRGLLVKPVPKARIAAELQRALYGQADPDASEAPIRQMGEFEARFGREKYQEVMSRFHADLGQLRTDLHEASQLALGHRQEAHRLAGSAAILDQDRAWELMQLINGCQAEQWGDLRPQCLADLDDILAAD